MSKPVLMPQVGQDLEEGRLVEWRVKLGDQVTKGDIVAVVESEKASFEVEAFESGTVTELLYEEGDVTKVLKPLLLLGGADDKAPAAGVTGDSAPAIEPLRETTATAAEDASADAAAVLESNDAPAAGAIAGTAEPIVGVGRRSSPLARRVGERHGIDLSALTGSGPRGAVVKRDVDEALQARSRAGHSQSEPGVAPTTKPLPATEAGTAGREHGLHRVWLRRGIGHPVVMIHGFGGDHNAWRVLVGGAALSCPILAVDLPGHGRSPGGAASLADMADAVVATLAEEGIEAADLVGHSLGAAVAVAVAEAARFTVRSLFLLSPAGLGPDINGDFLAGFCRARTEATLLPWMELLVADPASIGPAFVRVTAETRARPGVADAQDHVVRSLFPDSTQVFSVRSALASLPMPIRIVFGAIDRIVPARHLAGLPGTIAQHVFPAVGHMPQIEAREPVARLLAEHLLTAG